VPEPVLENHIFVGWRRTLPAPGENVNQTKAQVETRTVNNDMTFTAQWEEFIPVSEITGVPEEATALTPLPLTAAVVAPSNAKNKDIVWSVAVDGGTGASIIGGNVLNTTSAGTVTLRATIIDGTAPGVNYTQDISITVAAAFVPVSEITGVPTGATVGVPLPLTGTVDPNATNTTIVWSVVGDGGGTGASISGNTLNTTDPGTVTVRATVVNGSAIGHDFTEDFVITVTD
jgi:endo-1,4-beta-xylanase